MNERIRELAEQAGFLNKDEESIEYFAELIVRECINICNQAILQNQDTLSNLITYDLAEKMIIHGAINQAQKLGKGIKQHFGVEE
jgi:hypothetical protein